MTDTLAVVATNVNKPPIVIMRERLEARKGELKAALVDITPEQFIRAVITSATINPEIQACTWQSVWIACMQACRDGLLPDGVEGAIVPFKSKATWIPMYQGLLRRFRRSGKFKSISANVVREGDTFRYWEDENGPHLYYEPGENSDGQIKKIYARANTMDGGIFVTMMSIADANKRRNMSRATRDDAPWKLWPDEMLKKTVLRQLSKMLPSGRDIVPEEEMPELEAPAVAAPPIARAPGAAAALEQFSRASPASSDNPHPVTAVDDAREEGAERDPPGDQSAAATATDDPAPADDHTEHFENVAAYKRGQEAKAAGHARKAIPPEYRESDRTREALCWQSGYDGGTMPEFSNGET